MTNLRSYQLCLRIPFSQHAQQLLSSVWMIAANWSETGSQHTFDQPLPNRDVDGERCRTFLIYLLCLYLEDKSLKEVRLETNKILNILSSDFQDIEARQPRHQCAFVE